VRPLLALGFFLAATPLSAQEGVPWRASYFPYPIGNPTTGLMLVGHWHLARQADYQARVPFDGIFSAEAGWSTNNSRFIGAKFRAPQLVPGWRFAFDASAGRESSFGYFGRGPDGSSESIQPDENHPDELFRLRRTRYLVRGEVTRRIAGPFLIALGGGVTRFRYASTAAGSVFDADYPAAPFTGTDATVRLTLLVDTRDQEAIPANGVLLEAGGFAGSKTFEPPTGMPSSVGGGYHGGYLHLRGYVSPRGGSVIAGRFAARDMSSVAPLDAQNTLQGWEREVTVMGGAESHRSFIPGRFAGPGLLLGSIEVRHNLLDLGSMGAVTVIAFVDGGRIFGTEGFRWTTEGWKVGGGGAVAIRVLQGAPLILNFAGGPDGFRFTMGNGWAF
jgi:hypothetical protein